MVAAAPAKSNQYGPGTCAPYSNSGSCSVNVAAGSTLTLGTTGVAGALCRGDTVLTLMSPTGQQLASNDDSSGTRCSKIVYNAPTSGTYTIVETCYNNGSCGGTVGYNRA